MQVFLVYTDAEDPILVLEALRTVRCVLVLLSLVETSDMRRIDPIEKRLNESVSNIG